MDFDKKDGSGYLDGIPLKISSAFLPPPPVVLPPNMEELTLEKFEYDFSLEKRALECINKMKEKKKEDSKISQPENRSSPNPSNLQTLFSLQSDILLPKTQKSMDKVANSEEVISSKINLSDFENDMSSPFDYMELQTLNDLEELSSVFNNSTEGKNPFSKSMSFPHSECEGETAPVLPKVPLLNAAPDKSSLRVCKSYSDIHNLTSESNTMPERSSTPPPLTSNIVQEESSPDCDKLPDPYDELSEEDRRFVDAIVDMGFPRAQVSRTVRHLGKDEKMVVEHLCQIQSLEESGYDCLEAEAALHLHDYKHDQAKKFLDLISKFQDLGFEKDAVKKALIQNKNDWGKTIDALLS